MALHTEEEREEIRNNLEEFFSEKIGYEELEEVIFTDHVHESDETDVTSTEILVDSFGCDIGLQDLARKTTIMRVTDETGDMWKVHISDKPFMGGE